MTKKDDDFNLFLFSLAPDSVWKTAAVSEEPEIQLCEWDIKMGVDGQRYFVGSRARADLRATGSAPAGPNHSLV